MYHMNVPVVLAQSLRSAGFWRIINDAAAVEDFSLAEECHSSMGITVQVI